MSNWYLQNGKDSDVVISTRVRLKTKYNRAKHIIEQIIWINNDDIASPIIIPSLGIIFMISLLINGEMILGIFKDWTAWLIASGLSL